MINGVGNGYRYQLERELRNDATSGSETEKPGQVWDAVFTDKKENGVSVDDFLNLMVAQLRNQDFMNPVDDTQYVTQLAQFATMQQMQEMASYMKTNYVMSLVGKNVTAAKMKISGELQKETGTVEKISLVNNEFLVYVNGERFSLEQIMEINSSTENKNDETDETDPQKAEYLLSLMGKQVTVRQYDAEGNPGEKLSGVVEKISMEDGKYRVWLGEAWHSLDDILEVENESAPESTAGLGI